ncbi:hypothetical protein FACS189449_08760 [Alphaproteobacteria bacterium]|nr:hypothetical protein FACS189449_08760 [Alphaproteobacteria bacterium]
MFRIIRNVKGATAIEYALIASLIAVVAITGMRSIGQKMQAKLDDIAGNLGDSGAPSGNSP